MHYSWIVRSLHLLFFVPSSAQTPCVCVLCVRCSRYAVVLLLMVAIWTLIMSTLSFFFSWWNFFYFVFECNELSINGQWLCDYPLFFFATISCHITLLLLLLLKQYCLKNFSFFVVKVNREAFYYQIIINVIRQRSSS